MESRLLEKLKSMIIPILLGLLIVSASQAGFWEQAEVGIYDMFYRLRGAEDPGKDVLIIAIDEKSIAEIGPLPWPRKVHADLLAALSQSRVVAFDLLFDFLADEESDQLFAESINDNGNTILASMFTYEQDHDHIWDQLLLLPHHKFRLVSSGSGFINVPVDRGNTVRHITVADTNYFSVPYPSFSLAIALSYLNLTPEDLRVKDDHLTAGSLIVPVDQEYRTLIHYWGPGGTIPSYSYTDVLKHKYPSETWSGKIILVGVTTPAMMDYFDNPYTTDNLILTNALPSAGVEIHASAVMTYLNALYIRRASSMVNIFLLITIWLISLLMAIRLSPWKAAFSALILVTGIATLYYFIWLIGLLWLNLAAALIMITGIYFVMAVGNFVRSERERLWIKETFSRYLSPDYVSELINNPQEIKLGGVREPISVLFADLRNFTVYSDNEEPEIVISKLNEFFMAMTAIIFKHGGTLDKYLGDGFMAFFGAPVRDDKHAASALNAAIAMIVELAKLNRGWLEKGEETLKMGIGINSGFAIIGNIGSENRMDYTAVGRDINIASRLEELNKSYNTKIILGENTVNMIGVHDLSADWSIYSLGEVELTGLSGKIRIFSLKDETEKD
jgi:adenylate cyclase